VSRWAKALLGRPARPRALACVLSLGAFACQPPLEGHCDWMSALPDGTLTCTEPPPRPAVFSVKAEHELRSACDAAAARWEQATGVRFGCDEGEPLRFVDCDADSAFGGWATYERGIDVCRDMAHALDVVLSHEIGHLLVPGRHPSRGSLMCWKPAGTEAPISASDLEWACSSLDCTRFEPEGEGLARCPP
jgi:hypothetical protein